MSRSFQEYSYVRARETDELTRIVAALTGLQEHPGWLLVQGELGRQDEEQTLLLINRLRSHPEMARLAGVVSGLRWARDAVEGLHAVAANELAARQKAAEQEEGDG